MANRGGRDGIVGWAVVSRGSQMEAKKSRGARAWLKPRVVGGCSRQGGLAGFDCRE